MFSISATRSSTMHTIIFCIISFPALNVSATCNNNKYLGALNSDLIEASLFYSTYTIDIAISTPLAISLGCTKDPVKSMENIGPPYKYGRCRA
jgi:hypothetical protein